MSDQPPILEEVALEAFESAALEQAREALQDEFGEELRAARLAAKDLQASFDPADAAAREGFIYFEGTDGKWPAEAGSFKLPAHAIELDDDGSWMLTQTVHWPSGTPDVVIVALWLVWSDMARRIELAEPLTLRNEGSDFIAAGTLVVAD